MTSPNLSLSGRVVMVTGGSAGIGAAAARVLARHGARVVVVARRADKGEAVVREIEAAGGEARFIRADVTVRCQVEAMVAGTIAAYGRLDGAVNNAGIAGPVATPAAEIEESDWDAVMNLNLKAVWMSMKDEIPEMLKAGGGSIVNIASIYGLKGSDIGHAPYCASKFGVIGLTRTAAIDYAKQGVRVNAVCPGFTISEMVDPTVEENREFLQTVVERHSATMRFGESEEVGEMIAWLCSDAARFVNGAALPIDGGETSRIY